jgi:hypothetical protein
MMDRANTSHGGAPRGVTAIDRAGSRGREPCRYPGPRAIPCAFSAEICPVEDNRRSVLNASRIDLTRAVRLLSGTYGQTARPGR